jgi:hypothetical protein
MMNVWFAAVYGSGAFGEGEYSVGQTATGAAANAGGGSLVNTGVMVVSVATLACLLIFVALLTRLWKQKPKHYLRNR